ncbi:uncharacterized protein LOC131437131 isoform X1 [Malaya genurostris]|uniref:uncharacterized protein LOC131437131 isoform X1 n=1 Tax=Malaya genurostris TaxID=325434 RepID=UPI0026F3D673|nr:uncharacterized protein LOC131437131 isoform X1 [Malaya genurostris]XP_058462279.1 uncharacterized protein LOC131437131 isoform X1 [Malaya genurostris]XP_058462280.1 uncharacterized protein LOC131437131 isoform X1 [Malaya genurostris]
MSSKQAAFWIFLALLLNVMLICAYPQEHILKLPTDLQQLHPAYYTHTHLNRKFAEKPNAIKKVALDDIDDIQTNQIQDVGFSWSNMLGMLMQMVFNGGNNAPTKSDDIDNGGTFAQSPWANVISVGLKIITALLGGGVNDGVDKVDNGSSPMQNVLAAVFTAMFGAKDPDQVNTMAKQAGEFINIVVNLLDALKTSFSHRSISARELGKKDSLSDATIAGITVLKTYARSYYNSDNKCLLKYICEANNDCMKAVGGSSIFCQLGNYATCYVMEKKSHASFELLYEAGRSGRMGLDCRQLSLECNEV